MPDGDQEEKPQLLNPYPVVWKFRQGLLVHVLRRDDGNHASSAALADGVTNRTSDALESGTGPTR
jgi:hypothetical protein